MFNMCLARVKTPVNDESYTPNVRVKKPEKKPDVQY